MIRILFFALLVLALGWGFSWLADRPGELSILWQGQQIEMSLMVAAGLALGLFAALAIFWWLVSAIVSSPRAATRYFRARKRDRGYQALSTGLIAAGAGNAALASKMAGRSRGLISADQEPLIHLLEAQTALIEGNHEAARKKFEAMAEDPETRELGLRGLYLEARRLGADEAASHYAERAAEKAPYLPWAAEATLEARSRDGRYGDALALLDQQRAARVLPKADADRQKAVLLTAQAEARLESDPKGARDDAQHALKLLPGFAPAAVIAARALQREENYRKAASILEAAWKHQPHPDVARLYTRLRSGDSTADRLKRAEKLEAMRPGDVDGALAVAEAALDARDFVKARRKAEEAIATAPRESAFLLLADIEEAETGNDGRIRHWLGQAIRAPRDPAWVADGHVSERWLPVSPSSGRIGAFEWKQPFDALTVAELDMAPPEGPAATPAAETAEPSEPDEPQTLTLITAEQASAPVSVPPARAVDPPAPAEKPGDAVKLPERAKAEASPFFGHPPDDPGVRQPAQAEPDKTRLRLF